MTNVKVQAVKSRSREVSYDQKISRNKKIAKGEITRELTTVE